MDVEASLKIEKQKENIVWQTFKNQFFLTALRYWTIIKSTLPQELKLTEQTKFWILQGKNIFTSS